MAARKSERLINLTILLLGSRRFISRERIRHVIEGYRNLGDKTFERMFERDKDELRALGVPIAVGEDAESEEVGYRIERKVFELPPVEFTPAECTALGLAATVWQQATAADDTMTALAKLRAGGVDFTEQPQQVLAPRITATEEAFEPLRHAVVDRRVVRFEYRGKTLRNVQPWRLAWRSNSWYLIGHDLDRAQPRVFKLARITSAVEEIGRSDAFDIPDAPETAVGVVDLLDTDTGSAEVTVALRVGRAPMMRRRGEPIDAQVPEGFDAYRLQINPERDLGELIAHGPDLIVVDPPELRARIIDHFRRIVEE
ncbi:helix-turn-helix transcriptional regulator [Propionibacterium sp. oral taxon 192]|uniref:helix-turn-helix transcriptional regulator n=1 Tax=Propionibacterium sp. oral taxon 192 TaxID=671222 RepID=UPI000566F5A2|nr:WYL domain-containing protein [Propionibacterium sp. oral taxon 192]